MDLSQILESLGQQQLIAHPPITCASPGCRNLSLSDQNGYTNRLCYGHMLTSLTETFPPAVATTTTAVSSPTAEYPTPNHHPQQYLGFPSILASRSILFNRQRDNYFNNMYHEQAIRGYAPNNYFNNNATQDLKSSSLNQAVTPPTPTTTDCPFVQNQIMAPQQNYQIKQMTTPPNANPNNEFSFYMRPCPNNYCDGGVSCSNCASYSQSIYPTTYPQQIVHNNKSNDIPLCNQYGCRNPCQINNGQLLKFCCGAYCGTNDIQQGSQPMSPISSHAGTTPTTASGTPAFTAAIPALTMGMPTLTSGMATPTAGPSPLTIDTNQAPNLDPADSPIPSSATTMPETPTHNYDSTTSIVNYPENKLEESIVPYVIKDNNTLSPAMSIEPERKMSLKREAVDENDLEDDDIQPIKAKSKKKKMSSTSTTTTTSTDKNIPSRECSRTGCGRQTMTKNKRAKRYNAYCSPECFWKETETLLETRAVILDKNDSDYNKVSTKFKENLKSYRIKFILRLQMSSEITNRHFTAREKMMKSQGADDKSKISRKMYHGTKSICDPSKIITGGNPTFCKEKLCGMCGIISHGNRTSNSKTSGSMWFSDNSENALQYCNGSKLQAMFWVDVLTTNTEPIVAVDKDELVLPRYLILFGKN
ncbi:5633_t:CDS:2 [Ambispora leptoticha]|uniref:5633_t:CDS:1 n=1 Tax=Ambispora leptoticha TaxID=144679 RepID=A0A9N8ZEK4_9GLOM|nr:5633_t:CDS:2 [Ambispora leptoticha]